MFAPAFIVDTLREIAGDPALVRDVTDVLTGAANGLRAICSADQIAVFEWSTTRASAWVMAGIDAAAPGVRERELFEAMPWGGEPLTFHPVLAAGDTVQWGLRSASARRLELGDAAVIAIGLWGANCARGGIVAASAADLDESRATATSSGWSRPTGSRWPRGTRRSASACPAARCSPRCTTRWPAGSSRRRSTPGT